MVYMIQILYRSRCPQFDGQGGATSRVGVGCKSEEGGLGRPIIVSNKNFMFCFDKLRMILVSFRFQKYDIAAKDGEWC